CELQPMRFIRASIAAKSGLPIRSGLARAVTWAWMFKAYTQRDWAIFVQTFGQPLRIGKYNGSATQADQDTLYRAVANIAGDCAAIVPEGMAIEFVEAANVGAAHVLYKERAEWLDQQVSKAVLGQTSTTDAVTGGLGSGKEHRMVQEDIERADARAVAAVLNRDLIVPWIILNDGPQQKYPRLKIGREEDEDIAALGTVLPPLLDRGLKVQMSEVRDRLRFADPDPGAELLTPMATPAADPFGFGAPAPPAAPMLHAARAKLAAPAPPDVMAALAARMDVEGQPGVAQWIAHIEAMLARAHSLEEFRAMLMAAFPDLATAALGDPFALGLTAAHAAGRAAVEDEAGG
ncbi:MAG: DUF935 family protein, partial [Variibacter sp.]|nr:DUF935 family protein [Variibacter sp.]